MSRDNQMAMIYFRALAVLGGLAAAASALAQQPPYPQPPYQQPPYPQQPPAYQQPTYPQAPPQYQPPPPQYQQPPYPQQPPAYQQPPYPQQPPAYQQPYPPPPYQQPYPQQPYPPPAYPPYQQPPPSAPQATPQAAKAHHPVEMQYHPLRFSIGGGYTITQDDLSKTLQDGANAVARLMWFPIRAFPLGIGIDSTYSRFNQTLYARSQASTALGTNVAYGHEDQYGASAEAELDLKMGPNAKEYFFGGVGKYRRQTVFKQVTYQSGVVCNFVCAPAFFPVVSEVQNTTSDWVKTWNAGMGFEFNLEDPVSFFIEARYMRIAPYSAQNTVIPITVGLRF